MCTYVCYQETPAKKGKMRSSVVVTKPGERGNESGKIYVAVTVILLHIQDVYVISVNIAICTSFNLFFVRISFC